MALHSIFCFKVFKKPFFKSENVFNGYQTMSISVPLHRASPHCMLHMVCSAAAGLIQTDTSFAISPEDLRPHEARGPAERVFASLDVGEGSDMNTDSFTDPDTGERSDDCPWTPVTALRPCPDYYRSPVITNLMARGEAGVSVTAD